VLVGLAAELADDLRILAVELAPLAQVDTPGLRRRRAQDFEPFGYAAPDCFVRPVRFLIEAPPARLRRHHGRCLWVDPAGGLHTDSGEVLA
jgi:hypothetical protein